MLDSIYYAGSTETSRESYTNECEQSIHSSPALRRKFYRSRFRCSPSLLAAAMVIRSDIWQQQREEQQ